MQGLSLRWQNWRTRQHRPSASEAPLRAELLSVEQLARHAETLAQSHEVTTGLGSSYLLRRLAENEQRLRAFNHATLLVSPSRHITPAAEWLLDNFYLIEEQIHLARRHLPKGYSRELPRLTAGTGAGLPRVYHLMLELIAHMDAQIDLGSLGAFIAAYQRHQPLTLGELWAVPIMLRLGVIENLQRVTNWLTVARHDRDLADEWVDRLQAMAEKNPSGLVIVVADMAKSTLPLTSSFVAEFCQRLSRKTPELHLARSWLEQRLTERGMSIDDLIHRETQVQAADQVSVSNSIASLRFLGATDWRDFVEEHSVVNQILGNDPAGVYRQMDFATRDHYRHAVESLARFGARNELEVAQLAVDFANRGLRQQGAADRTAHIGYYLVDAGQASLEAEVEVRWPGRRRFENALRRHPIFSYLGTITVLTLGATLGFFAVAHSWLPGRGAIALFTALAALASSQLAVALANWLTSFAVRPQLLPRLDFSKGITPENRTMVVVPTMLGSADGVDHLVENLEVHFLANRDANLYFALLTDFRDAAQETMPEDADLLGRVRAGVERLNTKYPLDGGTRFYLFHRPRLWNESERRWIGRERKRGKLADFNAWLRHGATAAFSLVIGDPALVGTVRYAITLDTDTQLPRESAQKLAGTMAHPLNLPVVDGVRGIVTAGYGILQPRVGVSMSGAGQSWFARLFAGDAGIDPYTRAVSDVYQDLFDAGSFIGKGIYDVDVFERVLGARFPDNTILSHDLIESCYARSGLVSDVELYEEYPSRYNVDVARRHRWIRGDWQIGRWLLSHVPLANGETVPNVLPPLAQWKIFDNLRRSLVPIALLVLLVGGWLVRPLLGPAVTTLVLGVFFLPGILSTVVDATRKAPDLPWRLHLRRVGRSAGRMLVQNALGVAFLPYDAWIGTDAIGRTLFRLLISRRRLLEWQTSSDSARAARTGLATFYSDMWAAPLLAAVIVLIGTHGRAVPAILGGLWMTAPWVAWWISRPLEVTEPGLSEAQRAFLGRQARKIWRFFEEFVTERDNWLPPDNFQEVPVPVIASRTSPTNIGLALLTNLAAFDFGYVTAPRMISRIESTFATLRRLERYRGHFFNWYDTRTLEPLMPRYVSTVDSGNLNGHFAVLASGLRALGQAPIFRPEVLSGLRDTAGLLRESGPALPTLAQLETILSAEPFTLTAQAACLHSAMGQVERVMSDLAGQPDSRRALGLALQRECGEHLADLMALAPWLSLPTRPALRGGGASARFEAAMVKLDHAPTLRDVAELEQTMLPLIETLNAEVGRDGAPRSASEHDWLAEMRRGVHAASALARQRMIALEELARQCDEFMGMDFSFLYDSARKLFSIGFNVTDRRKDAGYYDLLASEARLGTYAAIAQGQVPQDAWFAMSRMLVAVNGEPILVSWSGSMFEYLMPSLVMPSYANTLVDYTCHAAVRRQIEYGKSRGVPWGVSESGYHRTDVNLNYQYRAFGVPGLGLKRGLAEDLVIAPYASVMATMVAPRAACANLERLVEEGREGEYGFYEAIDYTPSRLPPGSTSMTIRSFMAHHQGMSFLALVSVLRNEPMQRRFLESPLLRSAEALLQERIPNASANVYTDELEIKQPRKALGAETSGTMRIFTNPTPRAPEVHMLSNGRYHVVISTAGGGYSRWHDLAVTRWREDATRDCWGTFIYLRDIATGETWSAAHQPVGRKTRRYEAIFTQARAEFRQRQAGLEIHTQISVSPEDDVELRRVTIVNHGGSARAIELTSYAEVVIASASGEAAHPTFSNLFVQTEFLRDSSAILATRRARAADEHPPWLLAMCVGQGVGGSELSCETDRNAFVGRGRTLAAPAAMKSPGPLGGAVGSVLDPIIALRRVVRIEPNDSAVVDFIVGMSDRREGALALVDKYQSPRMADRAFDLAWTHSQVTLRQLDSNEADAQLFARLASALIYADPSRRAAASILAANRRGQSGLWSYGISGDAPIVLLRLTDNNRLELAKQLVKAHSYWRMKGLAVELVIINEDASVYRQSLNDQILHLIASGIEAQMLDKPGGIFVRRIEQIPHDDRVLLQAAARVVLDDEHGSLAEQLDQRTAPEPTTPELVPSRLPDHSPNPPLEPRELVFRNGLGGFTKDGHEYVTMLEPGRVTPAPWVNVIANPYFGTVVSESGSGYTWLENAHEFRLTPWHNDPVQDPPGEALYIRDEQTGEFWSPTPLPARGAAPYVSRHGFGYSVFEHVENGIVSELWVYVAMDAPVKFSVLKLRNISGRPRRLSVTGYWEWVLGELRPKTLLHVQTEVDRKTGALLARNYYGGEFADRIAFVDVNDAGRTLTGDRREFFGSNGTLAQPAALRRVRLSGRVGAGLDPCAALQVSFDLADGDERETTFRLGAGRNPADVQTLIQRFRAQGAARTALEAVWAYWNRALGAVNVDTPDPAVNAMANGWLVYQTISCRVWGRTGFYQSGGAYGFRDQLQDVMALMHAEPTLTREHLLRAAAHQFKEGDVQHWWHPLAGRGVRTHFSDDYLWLPYAVCRYVTSVADTGVLDERVAYLEGRPVQPEEEAYYDLPGRSAETGTLYEHCVRAIEHAFPKMGAHGLPLMGCGDWNDGMNLVGKEGRGESVWLAFFLYDVLTKFSGLASARQDFAFAERCTREAERLQHAIEEQAWDGDWYRRAYFDNGDPLGSKECPECQIDSLPQSWSVISGAGNRERSEKAMDAVNRRLVRRVARLVQLFDPPFDQSSLNPGYIKGYIPGVRENGGQYTHGAVWTAMAFALMGDAERAWECFNLLNPVHHGASPEQIATYKVEPYVVAADVYAVPPHTGRGGWTWYTGSAGWMYRLLVETLLGVNREGDHLRLTPRLPASWPSMKVHYRYHETTYHISVVRDQAAKEPVLTVDGAAVQGDRIPLANDRKEHFAEFRQPIARSAEK